MADPLPPERIAELRRIIDGFKRGVEMGWRATRIAFANELADFAERHAEALLAAAEENARATRRRTPMAKATTIYRAKRPDADYLRVNWNEGDRDVDIKMHRQRIATNAKPHVCVGNVDGEKHEVPKGERMLVQTALVEGEWGGYRLCLRCCDAWLDLVEGKENTDAS